jgi:hypothetical protein
MKLSLWQRLVLKVRGYAYIGHETREGWRGSLPFYVFKCKKHGLVKDYFHGFPPEQYLLCPLCFEEEVKR